jgi:isoprenylcysteine carboxyl methyltransferase (ICMT) family protein YpbQ
MVALHAAVLAGAAVEVVLLQRPFLPVLAAVAGALFLGANALRWWVIATLGGQWNVEVMEARAAGVVTGGPYRWVRHPNYVAVFVEMFALPLIHTAWLTAALGAPKTRCCWRIPPIARRWGASRGFCRGWCPVRRRESARRFPEIR